MERKNSRPHVQEKIERRKNIEEPKVKKDTRPHIEKKKEDRRKEGREKEYRSTY